MVLIFRFLLFTLLGAAAVCFVLYLFTGQLRWRQWGVRIMVATVATGLLFFGGLILGNQL